MCFKTRKREAVSPKSSELLQKERIIARIKSIENGKNEQIFDRTIRNGYIKKQYKASSRAISIEDIDV